MTACRLASGKVVHMKKIIFSLALMVLLLGLTGCEDDTKEKAKRMTYDNKSRLTVAVIPLSVEYGGFYLPSGEKRTFKDVTSPDFRYEPAEKVMESSESTERYVIFVDKPPEVKTE
jgi:hypothetical protein